MAKRKESHTIYIVRSLVLEFGRLKMENKAPRNLAQSPSVSGRGRSLEVDYLREDNRTFFSGVDLDKQARN